MQKTILITGGAGFVGSHVAKFLAERGFHTVVLDNLSSGDRRSVIHSDFFEGDIGDKPLLRKLFQRYKPQAVCHFAAFTDLRQSVEKPQFTFEENVTKTLKLLDAVLEAKIPFLFSSSAAVYGEQPPFTEEANPRPITPYGKSKLLIEQILLDYEKAYGLPFFAFRYFNAAGGSHPIKHMNESDFHLIPKALKSARNEEPITIFGKEHDTFDGTCIRDYIHVEDIALAHLIALETAPPSGIYNLGTGKGVSVLEVLEIVESVTKKKLEKLFSKKKEGDPPSLVASNKKAKEVLKFHPQKSSLRQIVSDAWNALN